MTRLPLDICFLSLHLIKISFPQAEINWITRINLTKCFIKQVVIKACENSSNVCDRNTMFFMKLYGIIYYIDDIARACVCYTILSLSFLTRN